MVNRIAEALDSPLISVGAEPAAPAGPGRREAERQHRRPLVQERGRRPALRQPAEPGPDGDPRHRQDRRGQPDPRGADQHRRRRPPGRPTATTSSWSARPGSTSTRWTSRPPGAPVSVIMFLGPLLHSYARVRAAVRRRLRPRRPDHRAAPAGAPPLRPRRGPDRRLLPLHGRSEPSSRPAPITLTERGDTVTENALLAAALSPGVTVLRNASPNYMVQDLCVFLTHLGVEIDGIGTTTLRIRGVREHQHRRRVRPVGGPDRGDEPAHRRRSSPSRS